MLASRGGTRIRAIYQAVFPVEHIHGKGWLVPGAGHNEAWIRAREAYECRVLSFFDRHLLGEGIGLPPGAM